MDKYIVYSKDLTKADTLILKNLEADIKDVLSKPESSPTKANGQCHSRHMHEPPHTDECEQTNLKMLPSARRRPCETAQPSRP